MRNLGNVMEVIINVWLMIAGIIIATIDKDLKLWFLCAITTILMNIYYEIKTNKHN